MTAPNPSVAITRQVYDFMMIEVSNTDLRSSFDYVITNQSNQRLRKGYFNGNTVQLRLSLLQEGSYQISLYSKEEMIMEIPFEKKAVNWGRLIG